MDIERTKIYYETEADDSLCQCDYCRNYYKEIKAAYPMLTEYLKGIGVDIEKPFETIPVGPWEGTIEYIGAQYIVMGSPSGFAETSVDGVDIFITDSHPMTDLDEEHFVIEITPIKLKWTI
ncbi:MAG: hypothetical protein II704_08615 [Erysipelotrichaceae bacterium]|nr:hypothetical protein [Erysipelotrichaceae bacterium]